MRHLIVVPALCLASCAAEAEHRALREIAAFPANAALEVAVGMEAPQTSTRPSPTSPPAPQSSTITGIPKANAGPRWGRGDFLLQGFLGVSQYEEVSVDNNSGDPIDGDEGDLDELPLIGGGMQYKLAGDRIDWGVEGFFSFSGRANAAAFAVGGGGAVVAVDVDLLLFDLYGGLFASMFLGDKVRVYAGAGPLLQWAEYEQDDTAIGEDGSGFGSGVYARTGAEWLIDRHTMVGLGARWSDSSIDLDSDVGDLDLEGFQIMLTVSRGL